MPVPQILPTSVSNESFGGVTYHVEGELVPVLHVELGSVPVYFEHHVLLWKDPQVNIGIKALAGAFKRILSGMPIFMTETRGHGHISFTPASDAKGITIVADVEDSLMITADADRLQQVVWNLVANAVKFTPKGGTVTIRALREGSHVTISVADTGEGIAPEALRFIFEPFRQADASMSRRHGGLGLGLAIVKQLVAAHGGTVDAGSEGLGRGSTFLVSLPALGAVPAVNVLASPPATGTIDTGRATVPRLDGLSVLVVDDEDDSRAVVDLVLRTQGAAVVTVASAVEALGILPSGKPDVIVSDIGMPEMDGYAFMRKVRTLSRHEGGRTPAVALTAYVQKDDAQRAFAAGFQMHVPKPVEPMQLVRIVANVAGRSLEDS